MILNVKNDFKEDYVKNEFISARIEFIYFFNASGHNFPNKKKKNSNQLIIILF